MYGCFMDQTGGHTVKCLSIQNNTTTFAASEVVVVGRWVWMYMNICDKVDTHILVSNQHVCSQSHVSFS